jgi:subtilisin family serine protease
MNLTLLEAPARHPQVEAIEKQRRCHTVLSDSVPDIHANQVWHRNDDNFTGYTGRGVVVGIVDTGIDFRHQVFRKPDGRTRILKIWDQTLTAEGGEKAPGPITTPSLLDPEKPDKPIPLGYGVEYDWKDINATLGYPGDSPAIQVRHQDEVLHGTSVAGIAAGDGSQSGGCHLSYHYIGVAPEADLIVVRQWGLTKSGLTKSDKNPLPDGTNVHIDAIRYILNEAQHNNNNNNKPPQPVAINLSFERFSFQMDGSSPDCRSVNQLLTNNSVGTAM